MLYSVFYLNLFGLALCGHFLVSCASTNTATSGPTLTDQQDEGKLLADKERLGNVFNASKRGNLAAVKSFLSGNDSDVNARDANGKSALDYAIEYEHIKIIKYLIDEKGVAYHSDMFTAAQTGQLAMVRYFIEVKHQDVESRDKDGWNALHWATEYSQMKVLRYLMEDRKQFVDSRDRKGLTALHWSAHYGHLEMVKYLAENGADVNARSDHGSTPLYEAMLTNRLKVMKYLIDERGVAHDPDIYTAAKMGHLSMVRYFIEEKQQDVEGRDKYGWNALHWATGDGGHLNVMRYLIEERKQFVDSKDNNDWTSLHWCAHYGHLELVRYLVEKGADVNAKTKDNETPLDLAIAKGDLRIIKYLLDDRKVPYEGGIFAAAKSGQLVMVKFFIEEKGQDVDARNEEDLSALNVAAIFGHLDIVQYLIEERGQSTELKLHKTMLMAVASGQLEVVKYLVARGVKVDNVKLGEKSLLEAIIKVSSTIFSAQQGDSPSDEAYLKEKAPASLVKERSYLKMIKYLIDEQGLVYEGDLFTAARDGQPGMVEYFIEEKGQSINSKDKDGWTPMHWAAANNRLRVVKYLFGKGADVNAVDSSNRTALDVGTEKKREKTVKYLRDKVILSPTPGR